MNEARSKERKRAFGAAISTMKSPFNRCYYPGDECKEKAIRAHSVQNARMLELLQQDGHVVSPKFDMSFDRGPKLTFEHIGRNHATTFNGLCGFHDNHIFEPIETNALALNNKEHLFLLSYRAVLKEAHASAKSARDTQAGYQAGVESGLFPDAPCSPGLAAVEHMSLAYMTHLHKVNYDSIFQSKRWDGLAHYQLDLEVPPCLAVNSLLSTGRYSKQSDSLAYATLNVFPHGGTTFLLFSYLENHRKQFNRSFRRFIESGDRLEKLSHLVLKRCENFVISPKIYGSFTAQQKRECQRFFERNIGEHEYKSQHPELINLFGAVA